MGITIIGGSTGSASKIEKTEYIRSTQSWTAPDDVTKIDIILCGGGGGGGKTNIGAGGGSGSYTFDTLAVTPSTSYTVTIGAGGAGSTTDYVEAGTGGTSSFGALLSVAGGGPGRPWNTAPQPAPGGFGAQGAFLNTNSSENGVLPGIGGMVIGGSGGTGMSSGFNLSSTVGHNGGGAGAWSNNAAPGTGRPNSGAGGGGGNNSYNGAAGGSGVAIIKYWSAL